MYNVLVCIKAVPVTAQVAVDGAFRLQREGTDLQWNIADQSALEAALQFKGAGGKVTVLTMGPKKLVTPLQELFGRGVDRVVLLSDPALAGADTYATAKVLASAAKKLGEFDLILCGRRAIDGETGQVPGMLAAALGLPCVSNVESLCNEDGRLTLCRRLETGTATLKIQTPAVVSVCEYVYNLRLPGILAMRRAREKQIELYTAADLQLLPEDCGLRGSLTKVVGMTTQFPGMRKCQKVADPATAATQLLQFCREVDQ